MTEERWEDAHRLEAWAGEVRVNLIRAAALVVFYVHHLLNVFVFSNDDKLRGTFHATVTAIVLAWAVGVYALYVCLSRRWVPPALKYVASLGDVAMISALLIVNPDGPHSPLIFLYFVAVAAAPLRLSLRLVYATTLGSMAAAVIVLGHYVFLRIGSADYYDPEKPYRIARSAEVIFLLSLGTAGLLAGQVVRQARRPGQVTEPFAQGLAAPTFSRLRERKREAAPSGEEL
jgi:hypothetical protein